MARPLLMIPLLCASMLSAGESWPADVPGFKPPAPGEHPRLLFRVSDLPAIRARAETPEGKAILARIRHLLGNNGESYTTVKSPATKGYMLGERKVMTRYEPGCLTVGHAAGYGLLYQVTGDKKYAEFGLKAFEDYLKGVRDRDDRYSFMGPNGELRTGASWGATALGYDLCSPGWSEADRKRIAAAFLTARLEGGKDGLEKTVTKPKYGPEKNHTGGIISSAVAAAAIMGDPGADSAPIAATWLPANYKHTVAMFTKGFGDGGFYAEGHGASHVSSNTMLCTWLKVAKVACGKDFITPRPNAQWMTLRWAFEIIPIDGVPQYPHRSGAGESYGTEIMERNGMSHGGQFAEGFGAVDAKYVPALLWVYQNFVEPGEHDPRAWKGVPDPTVYLPKGEKSYDSFIYPHKAVQAFVNWPIGVKPENPQTVLPRVMRDSVFGYYGVRSGWKDADDCLVTALLGIGPKADYRCTEFPVIVWGFGKKMRLGQFTAKSAGDWKPKADGSGMVLSVEGKTLAVDVSGAAGCPMVIVTAGIDGSGDGSVMRSTTVEAGGMKLTVHTLAKGTHPEVKASGSSVTVGGQTISVAGGTVAFVK